MLYSLLVGKQFSCHAQSSKSPEFLSELLKRVSTPDVPGCFGRTGVLGDRASEPLTLARWSAGRAARVRLKAVLIRPT